MHQAQKAASCLLSPETGDLVLISLDNEGLCFVLAVLVRGAENKSPQRISFDGPTHLQVMNGDLSLTSDHDINLASENRIACATDEIAVQAQNARVVSKHLFILGQALTAQIGRIKSIARSVEHVYKLSTQRLDNSFRYVAEHDEIQSKTSRILVEDLMSVQTKNTCHLADETIKIDAEHINLG